MMFISHRTCPQKMYECKAELLKMLKGVSTMMHEHASRLDAGGEFNFPNASIAIHKKGLDRSYFYI